MFGQGRPLEKGAIGYQDRVVRSHLNADGNDR